MIAQLAAAIYEMIGSKCAKYVSNKRIWDRFIDLDR